ncbi:Lipoprotein [Nocardia ninae]|uniref:Lipoprotein n=1 Tax=Nocardia ninae NBRC 108245 TaxID=1210091 RepID=A0A511MJ05_9NOCA|nr:hypothetical protein NN4_44350 [Nocardia ninae NBRC 108245]
MRAPRMTVFSAFVLAASLTACNGPTADNPTQPPTTTLAFPYPPKQYYTEVAVPLEEPLLSAANFALEMLVDDERVYDPREAASIRPAFLSKADPDGYTRANANPYQPSDFVDDTGGETLRAIDVQELSDGLVEVSICIFDSPGVYTLKKGGNVQGPDSPQNPYGLRRTQVRWTNQPAADGSIPASSRWLWVHNGLDLHMNYRTMESACQPFKPDPFIQKMPDPTTPIPAPTPTR